VPQVGAVAFAIGIKLIVVGYGIDLAIGDGGGATERHTDALTPDFPAIASIERHDIAEARGHEDAALVIGDTTAKAGIPVFVTPAERHLPALPAGLGVHGHHILVGIQHEERAITHHGGGHQATVAVGAHGD